MSMLSPKSAASDERQVVMDIAQLSIRAGTCDVEAPMTATEESGDFVPIAQQWMSLSPALLDHWANSGWTGPMLSA